MIPFFAFIQGWDQLVSACLGVLAAGVAALGPKLVTAIGAWLDRLSQGREPAVAADAPTGNGTVAPETPPGSEERQFRPPPEMPPPPSAEV